MRKLAKSFSLIIAILLGGVLNTARAEVLVLVHGYMGSPASWEESGINILLDQSGWKRGGIVIADNGNFLPDPETSRLKNPPENISYMVDLPWMLPLQDQADRLENAMQTIFKLRPNEKVTLIGHSAGALAARIWLVEYYQPEVVRMISIAAPNLGTPRAIDALELTDPTFPPLEAVRRVFGGKLYNTVRHSRPLMRDFTPPSRRNPNILYWLNQQPHPDIEYYSIVREDRRGVDKDWLMSADSQDLNNVPALSGKSESFIVPRKHPLNPQDGYLLASILSQPHRDRPASKTQ